MTTDVWIGGGSNEASDPAGWLTGLPIAGETLMTGGPQGSAFTMKVQGNQLAGDMISSAGCALTIEASGKAVVHSTVGYRGDVTFDLSQQSTLYLSAGYLGKATVNLSGTDTLIIDGSSLGCPVVNLAAHSEWIGAFRTDYAQITAGTGATFDNDGASTVLSGGPGPSDVVLPVSVIGKGSFSVAAGARLEFMKPVGAQQSVTNQGTLAIDAQFSGAVALQAGEIDLAGLASADGYAFKADMLRVYAGGQLIDTLRLSDQTPFGFEVEKTAAGIGIVAYADTSRTPVGMPLAMHIA